MATALTSVFGSEIIVADQPRIADRQLAGFAGAHGLVGMLMGSRGAPVIVRGTLRGSGGNYAAARQAVQALVDAIEAYQWLPEDDYTFNGKTYADVIWNRIQLLPDNKGTVYHFTAAGTVIVNFIAIGISLT